MTTDSRGLEAFSTIMIVLPSFQENPPKVVKTSVVLVTLPLLPSLLPTHELTQTARAERKSDGSMKGQKSVSGWLENVELIVPWTLAKKQPSLFNLSTQTITEHSQEVLECCPWDVARCCPGGGSEPPQEGRNYRQQLL